MPKSKYRALTAISYPPKKRVKAGDIADGLPERSAEWLLERGLIEPVAEKKVADESDDKEEG